MKKITKSIAKIMTPPPQHWVGNGFFVHGFFNDFTQENSPFLLFDYAATKRFESSSVQRGVGSHPHRGFETVTIALKGKIQHKDSRGNIGTIQEGGVQWMTAGSGILHQEFFEKDFNQKGGDFQMVQIWVNLPAVHKMTEPKYQGFDAANIPVEDINGNKLSIIAGKYNKTQGAANTFSPVNMWVLDLTAELDLQVVENYTTLVLVLEGRAQINETTVETNHLIKFEDQGNTINLKNTIGSHSKLLILNAEPIAENIAHYGPFVMNTKEELVQAIDDFNSGKFGVMD